MNKAINENLKILIDSAVLRTKKEVFDDIEDWLSQEGEDDWRAWDSDYLDKYDKMKAKHLNTNNTDSKNKEDGNEEINK